MVKLAIAILLLSSPALAQSSSEPPDCQPIGQTAKGEMVYAMDCKALKAETVGSSYKPDMPGTNLPETVIPKPGGKESPPETQPTGEMK
jgi:hypothetical protein